MLEIKNVSKHYVGGTDAVKNVSLTIKQGEIIGLFGENGAGKTTLIKCILGLIKHDGEVFLDGQLITRKNIERLSLGTCEHSFFPTLTAAEHKEFYESHFSGFRKDRFKGLTEFFDFPLKRPIKQLSAGQQNQLEVILALCQGADYIFLDEPFVGYDIFNREDFYKVLLGILEPTETIVLATHLIEETEGFIDRSVMIHKGELLADVSVSALEERGDTLVDFIKKTYGYQSDRVGKSLEEIMGKKQTGGGQL